MKDPLGVSPSKGNQGTTRGKEKILLTSVGIESACNHTSVCLPRSRWSKCESYTVNACPLFYVAIQYVKDLCRIKLCGLQDLRPALSQRLL